MVADFYTILGVSKTATTAEVRKAYALLARDKHPDRFSDPGEKEKAQRVFKEITEAFNTLANERERQAYDRSIEKPRATTPEELAREAYAEGQAALQTGSIEEAISRLRVAVHHVPGEPQYLSLLAKALSGSSQTAHEAVDTFERAIRLRPEQLSLYVDLARLLSKLGLRLRARRVMEQAQELAPRDPQVQSLVAELGQEGGPKGVR
jgi:curved DNA-binding protein CbpA